VTIAVYRCTIKQQPINECDGQWTDEVLPTICNTINSIFVTKWFLMPHPIIPWRIRLQRIYR